MLNEIFQNISGVLLLSVKYSSEYVCVWVTNTNTMKKKTK